MFYRYVPTCADGNLYVGSAVHLRRRFNEHR